MGKALALLVPVIAAVVIVIVISKHIQRSRRNRWGKPDDNS